MNCMKVDLLKSVGSVCGCETTKFQKLVLKTIIRIEIPLKSG